MPYRINVCSCSTCKHTAPELAERFRSALERYGLDDVEVAETGSIGLCAKGPVVMVKEFSSPMNKFEKDPSTEVYYIGVTYDKVDRIVEALKKGAVVQEWTFPKDSPVFSLQKRVVMEYSGYISPESIEEYITVGGYQALEKVLKEMSPDSVIEEIIASGLRGRGGAAFPTGLKWKFTRKAKGTPKYVIVNVEEGEIGVYANVFQCETNPHQALEGTIIAGYAIGAEKAYIYINSKYHLALSRMRKAVEDAYNRGFLGRNILGTGFSFDVEVFTGASAYVSGEETAIIAAIEGKRPHPTNRPPYPAEHGLHGKPTLINNPETLAAVPLIIMRGAKWYSSIGTEDSKGTKCISLIGRVNHPIIAEVPFGITLKDIIYSIGGGLQGGQKLKAILVGGPSGGFLPAEYINLPYDYKIITEHGGMVGSGGILVLGENDCIVETLELLMRFFVEESCGQCIPCRVGLEKVYEMTRMIEEGEGNLEYLELIEELSEMIRDTSLCGLGQMACTPLVTAIKHFKDEFIAHIEEKRCPYKV